ncbi:helix-turn-helix domain-containing protein [Miltoncostaea oceani]|uniref:helix-turn-helix domain-containing protein n=1 Tax=Miltoncostaea oceani TaxID=2843216 RepID=UPI001C3D688F|nr:helix-turn-helix transcriptional regulator [Miltoncostaea oceani]
MAGAGQTKQGNGTDPVRLEDVLRSARETSGLSIRRLAERTGLHHAGLARIELGEQRPTPDTLLALAQALELDEADLFALAGYRLPDRLPSFPAYLRAKYRMPDEAATQLNEYFGFLKTKYGIENKGDLDADSTDVRDQRKNPPISS